MFGYLTARPELLDEERAARYKACYCGLCRSLRSRHGQLAGLTLNYDVTFLALLLSSLYEPEERGGSAPCLVHPFAARAWFAGEITDYCADMNLALGYLKCMDDRRDDGSLLAATEGALLRRAYRAAAEKYPRQCSAMENSIAELTAIERAGLDEPDRASAVFGAMMAELFDYRSDRWSPPLRAMGDMLGRFIYVMDACMDLDADVRRGRYNPFRGRFGLDNGEYFRSVLQMLLGECLSHYDRLPLVQDKDILDNILCAGVWAQFDAKYKSSESDQKGTQDVSGSV